MVEIVKKDGCETTIKIEEQIVIPSTAFKLFKMELEDLLEEYRL